MLATVELDPEPGLAAREIDDERRHDQIASSAGVGLLRKARARRG